jgi:Xaa-Pro aminopeptidase
MLPGAPRSAQWGYNPYEGGTLSSTTTAAPTTLSKKLARAEAKTLLSESELLSELDAKIKSGDVNLDFKGSEAEIRAMKNDIAIDEFYRSHEQDDVAMGRLRKFFEIGKSAGDDWCGDPSRASTTPKACAIRIDNNSSANVSLQTRVGSQ